MGFPVTLVDSCHLRYPGGRYDIYDHEMHHIGVFKEDFA